MKGNAAAKAFLDYLASDAGKAVIASYGYATGADLADLAPLWLTLRLAALVTGLLLVIGIAARMVARTHQKPPGALRSKR